ncbi:ribulose-phosphate 3-epimerase [Nematocida major]|uniref:ribulose-phosphate 3-epimerase n=1 Tax=Nematocida major TaxID=1912982 RepID=UPI0020078303|nr:ribulose-phosphate 3-epimerase [Nematocida major]KAH9386146.1 ribulose-phosphate 3-epimerase [Nematocida major]
MKRKKMKVYGSILSCDTLRINDEIEKVKKMGVHGLHLDVMDGVFVEKIGFSEDTVNRISREHPDLLIECHLMVEDPLRVLRNIETQRLHRVIIHQAERFLEVSAYVQEHGECRVGVAVESGDELLKVPAGVISRVEKVLVMGVRPGRGGQRMRESLRRDVEVALRRCPRAVVGVDGGVNESTLAQVEGAHEVVMGSCLFEPHGERNVVAAQKRHPSREQRE